jgi:hypothetical protein
VATKQACSDKSRFWTQHAGRAAMSCVAYAAMLGGLGAAHGWVKAGCGELRSRVGLSTYIVGAGLSLDNR